MIHGVCEVGVCVCWGIGMVRTAEGKLHFFLDGIDQGVACEQVPQGKNVNDKVERMNR